MDSGNSSGNSRMNTGIFTMDTSYGDELRFPTLNSVSGNDACPVTSPSTSKPPKPLTRFPGDNNNNHTEFPVGSYISGGSANNKPVYKRRNGSYYYYTDNLNQVIVNPLKHQFIKFFN